jgi:hypothetical protein
MAPNSRTRLSSVNFAAPEQHGLQTFSNTHVLINFRHVNGAAHKKAAPFPERHYSAFKLLENSVFIV